MRSLRRIPLVAAVLAAILTVSLPISAGAQRGDHGGRSSGSRGDARGGNSGARGGDSGRWRGNPGGSRGYSGGYGRGGSPGIVRYRDPGGRGSVIDPRGGIRGDWRAPGARYGAGYGYPAYRYRYPYRSYGPRVRFAFYGPRFFYTPYFPRPRFFFVSGFALGVAIGPVPWDGYSYYDPYCGREFDSLDDYYDHCDDYGHPTAIEVIDVRGRAVATCGYHGGRWIVDDCY